MLGKRIIATMLCRGRTLVKGKAFVGDRSIGHVLQAAKVHGMRGVDELAILDIGATAEKRGPDLDMIRRLSEGCFIPITVGGGVRSCDDIDKLLRAGADKVCIGTALVEELDLVSDAAARFGRQAIVASVDCIDATVAVHCGRTRVDLRLDDGAVPMTPLEFAKGMEAMGAGEILLQSIARDGTLEGYDLAQIQTVSAALSIPVIASGGAGSYAHMLAALNAGADAVAAGALWAFTDATPRGAAQYLKENGKCVRL